MDALLDALDRLRDTGPEYDGFLANHGPMAAEAMVRLGHAEHVPGWIARYRTRLAPRPASTDRIHSSAWAEHVGDLRRLGDWIDFFERRLAEEDWRQVLATWWPRLLPGAAASATHGIIRTAHAVRSLASAGDPDDLLTAELGSGLAYWAARFQYLPGSPGGGTVTDAVSAVTALPRLGPDVVSAGPGIGGRLAALTQLRDLPDALDRWGWSGDDAAAALDELIGAAARVLAARDDAPIAFCHAVTAPAAVQLVLPHLPAELHAASVATSWQVIGAIVAAYASPRSAGEADAADPADAGDPAELAWRAVEHGDEHVIKLTEAALRQHRRTGDATLLVAAERFRSRLSPAR